MCARPLCGRRRSCNPRSAKLPPGILAFLIFIFLWLYPLRKRWKALAFTGTVGKWLDVHVAAAIGLHLTCRQGGWAGLSLNVGSHLRLNTDARQSRGGAGNDVASYTGSFGVSRLTRLGLGAQLRCSTYSGSASQGQLVSASVEVNPWNRFHLEASSGRRTDGRPVADVAARTLRWTGLDADFGLGRFLYVMLSAYRELGDAGRSSQGYAAISWRF